MKKYLMMGAAALTMGFAFVSCSSDDDIYNPDAQSEKVVKNFEQAFVQAFGQPAADQTWGFSQTRATRAANVKGNLWYKTWDRPVNVALSDAEIEELKALLTKNEPTTNTVIIPYENYWVQQVYQGEATYRAKDNNGGYSNEYVKGSEKMNHLQAKNGESYTHINNFNYGNNTTEMVDEGNGYRYVGTTLMENMPTTGITANNQFGFDESWGTENNKFYNNYIIVEYKGNWYVGFDFEAHKAKTTFNNGEAMQVDRDWVFTDWIVKITPAYHIGGTPTADYKDIADYRVIAEDLPTSVTDFDYNDVVFDVYYNQNDNTKAKIQLIAAGATLQITVNGSDVTEDVAATQNEVHSLFGVGASEMVNTGLKSATAEAFEVTIDRSKYDDGIRIMVNKGTQEEPQWFTLNAFKGEPAAKIKVDHDYDYCSERQDIVKKYPRFADYVSNQTIKWYPAE